ncbi:MAG: hypothetical protein NZ805_05720 [Armatimonadetes bacterium]|nr:hypothetical protein [Armatimonadota bacterium]
MSHFAHCTPHLVSFCCYYATNKRQRKGQKSPLFTKKNFALYYKLCWQVRSQHQLVVLMLVRDVAQTVSLRYNRRP